MRNKLILFLMLALLGSTNFLRADELTVHDGTATSSYVPAYGFYADAYLKCEMVYPAAELTSMDGGDITGLTFYATSPAAEAWTGTWQVFVTEVASASISDFAGPGTVVYEGLLDGTQSEMTITFNNPYTYNGGNLLVGVYLTTIGNYKSVTWGGEEVNGASVQGYSYSSLSAVSATQRNFLPKTTFAYEVSGPTPPPTPTGDLSITPNDAFALGDRPSNGWMEPFTVRLYNGGADAIVSASVSNTSDQEPFILSEEIDNYTLATDEALEFEVEWNSNAADGSYTEEFTLFYAESSRDIITIPVTAEIYEAGNADIVETVEPIGLSYTSGVANFEETPADLHPNYLLQGMTEMMTDAVYSFTLSKDSKLSVTAGDNVIAIYNKVTGFHPTASVEPVAIVTNGTMTDQILLAGQYYMIVASDNITTVEGTVEQVPAPTEITNLTPEDGTTGIEGNTTLTWEGGDNATQYQVLFGTSPTNLTVALDWTMIDENYGTFNVTNLSANTQYFWQIKVKNSNGTVTGPRWGFTTALIAPNNVTASAEEIFVDETTLIKWRLAGGAGFTGELTVADGTTTNSYVPVYGLWCDYYTRSEMIYPAEMLEEMLGGEITSLTFYLSSPASGPWSPDVFQVYFQEVDATTLSTYYTATNAQISYTGALDGTGTTMVINLDDPYVYQGGNLLIGIQETVNGTYKSASFYGVTATGASASGYNSSSLAGVTFNQRNFLPKVTFTCGARNTYVVENTRSHLGFNVYYGDVKANTELITERQYLLSNLPYNVEPGHNVTVTAVYDEGESELSNPVVVKVSGYGTFTGTVTELISGDPVSDVTVTFSGKDEFNNNVSFQGTTNASGVYTINNVKAGNYTGTATKDGMEPKVSDPVTLAYNTTETVNFVMHEVYTPVFKVFAQELDPTTAKVTWSRWDFVNPTSGNGGTPVADQTFNFDDNTLMGWTNIDGDGDGNVWVSSANPGIYHNSGVSLSGTGHNDSEAYVISGSYANQTYQALTPNNFLVSPEKAAYSGITFYACAQDASYAAEHFSVEVSTEGNTAASDFTTIQEWTMTAKGQGAMSAGRDGQVRQGNWYEYHVDFSAYNGQDIWVAIRHFNCTDQFILNVDDITLHGSRANRDVQEYAVYRKALLKQTEITPEDSVYFGNTTDTLYADFRWDTVAPGLYQYGVSAIYPSVRGGNRDEVIIGEGTATDSYVPTYNLYNYSCTNQIYTGEEIGGAGTINSIAFMPATVNASSRNLNVYMVNTDKTSFSGATDWIPVTDADLVYSGTVNWVANSWCTIELTNPFAFDGSNLAVIVNDLTGSWTSSNRYYVSDATAQAIHIHQDSAPYNPAAPGNGTVANVKNNIKLDITYGSGNGGNDNPVTPITWSNILPKDIETYVSVTAVIPVGTAEGATVLLTNTFEGFDVRGTIDSTGTIEFPEFRKGEYELTVELEGYTSNFMATPVSVWDTIEFVANLEEIFKPIDVLSVSQTGYARWSDILPHEERIPERYVVTLNGTMITETTDNFLQFEDLTEGETYDAAVAVIYSTGMSTYKHASFTYVECFEYAFDTIYATNEEMDVTVTWANGVTPPTPGEGQWYFYGDDNQTTGVGAGGAFYWAVMFPAGSYQGNTVTKVANYGAHDDYYGTNGAFSGTVTIYNDGTSAPATAVGSMNISMPDTDQLVEFEFPTPVTIDPTKNLWVVFYNSNSSDYIGSCCNDSGNPNGRWVSLDGSSWMDLATAGVSGYNWMIKVYVAQGAKGEAHEISVPEYQVNNAGALSMIEHHQNSHETADVCGSSTAMSMGGRGMWDLITTFNAAEGGHYGVVTDGQYIYTSNWGYSSAAHNFYKYDMNGNVIEGFEIPGCGTLRGMTFDGEYVYGVANAATIYCVDLNNHTLVSTVTSAYGAMRCISYDPERDGFWVVGNWSGNLTLIDRTGAIVQAGPAPTSASDVAYFKDADGVEHVYCFNNADNGVYDYNINTNTMGGQVYNLSSAPGFNGGSSGGCHIANYGDKLAFYGDIQQSPNLIAIYELGEAISGGGSTATAITPNKFNIFVDGEVVGATSDYTFTWTCPDYAEHLYEVVWVDGEYNFSCPASIVYRIDPTEVSENSVINAIYPNPTSGDLHIKAYDMVRITVVNMLGQVVYDMAVEGNETVLNMGRFDNGLYMVNVITKNGSSVERIVVTK